MPALKVSAPGGSAADGQPRSTQTRETDLT